MSDNQLIYACDVCIHQEKITNKKKTKKMKKTKMMMMKKKRFSNLLTGFKFFDKLNICQTSILVFGTNDTNRGLST